jgi:hypothetical protein
MKSLTLIVLLLFIAGCKKDDKKDMPAPDIYPYTRLIGHTWEGLSYVDSLGTPYYQFLDMKSDTTIGIYTGVYDASRIIEPEIVYPCKVIINTNHQDSFAILYPGFSEPTKGYTTRDTTKIIVEYVTYFKFK